MLPKLAGQVGGLGVQNYPHTLALACYYLLPKVKVALMMMIVQVVIIVDD